MTSETGAKYFLRFPALVASLALVAGILAGWYVAIPVDVSAVGIIFFLCLALFMGIVPFSRRLAFLPLLLFGLSLGALKITLDAKSLPSDNIIYSLPTADSLITVKGTISQRAILRGRRLGFVIDAESLITANGSRHIEGGISCSLFADSVSPLLMPSLGEGCRIAVNGELLPLEEPRNPGEFDFKQYQIMHDCYARLAIGADTDITALPRPVGFSFHAVLVSIREYLNSTIDSLAGGEEANLLRGLIIGERTEMSPEVKSAFMNSGLMHILAVSGFNVGLVVMIFSALFSFARLRQGAAFMMISLSLILFGFVTGAQPSVFRAVVMAILFIGGRLLERKADIFNILAVAAIVLLLFDARSLFDVGFLLSFFAVGGLAYFYPKLDELGKHVSEKFRTNFLWKFLLGSVAVSLAATLGTLPLTAFYFQKVSLVGIVLNIFAVPLSAVILALGFAAMAAGLVSLTFAQYFALPAFYLSRLLLAMTVAGSRLPFAFLDVHPQAWMVILAYVLLVYIAVAQGRTIVGRILLSMMLVLLIILGLNIYNTTHKTLSITFLDVGQGDAAFAEFPDGSTMLIDTGPLTQYTDAGKRFIFPFLQNRGIKEIGTLVISHPHDDHIGGAIYLMRNIRIRRVVDDGVLSQSRIDSLYLHLIDSLHIIHRQVGGGDTLAIDRDVRVFVLHPSGTFSASHQRVRGGFNNQSLVLKLCFGVTAVLCTGDAQTDAEQLMIDAYHDFLNAGLLKVGHHGSITATSNRFLGAVQPTYAVISVGLHNKFSHPSPKTLLKLDASHVQYYRTDLHGAVQFSSDGNCWKEIEWRQR